MWGFFMMKKFHISYSFLLAILLAFSAISADAATNKKSKKKQKTKHKQTTTVVSPYVISIGYPGITAAYSAVKARADVPPKANAKPFGWQQRGGNWYVSNEKPNFEWAFTEPGHYAHPSVAKRMIDIGSKDHIYVDMAFRCGAANSANCDKLLAEFKEVNVLIKKVYQKNYIQTADATTTWTGVESLD